MVAQTLEKPKKPLIYLMLRKLFASPCLILMLGDWREGKTDTSLLIGHLGKKWGFIDKIGSNIYTYDNPNVDYVISMGSLRRWLHYDRLTKLFLFDEALTHLPSRRAMSRKNVDFIGLVTELSKAHGRVIIISQTEKVDSTLKDSAFLRAIMYKISKKRMKVVSRLFPTPLQFNAIPRSPIRFDKDRLAEFWESEAIAYSDLTDEGKVAKAYADGFSYSWIRDNLKIHPETAKRHVRKCLDAFFKGKQLNVVNKPNWASLEKRRKS